MNRRCLRATLPAMERCSQATSRGRLSRGLVFLAAVLLIIAGAIPATALAWVGPDPAATPRPTEQAPVSTPRGQVIYDTVGGASGAPVAPLQPVADAGAERAAAASAAGAAAAKETVKPTATAAPKTTTSRTTTSGSTTSATSATVYRGTNHMWFPALGINHSVTWYACSASYALSYSAVYRWGCAGTNNVYLMAHAGGVFGPLYTAYYAGRLKAGMLVVYADGASHIHYFKLQWWRTTPPSGDVGWAYAAQSVSSLTLQTCVGADSSLRLVVRFVEVAEP
jgi:hypothetical protein